MERDAESGLDWFSPGRYYSSAQENRLLSTAGMTYTYDASGTRVLKSNTSTGAAVKRYWSGVGNVLAEGDGSGVLTAEYVYFGWKRVARIDLPANSVHYYFSDHLGSSSVVASATGSVEEESDFYPFGTEVVVTGPGSNKYKFTGKERDTETGLDYFGARFDASSLGRFMSPDAGPFHLSNPQAFNRYPYALNNPLRYVDPDGNAPLDSSIVNTLANFYQRRNQLMGQFTRDYQRDGTLPPSVSSELQKSIVAAAVFSNGDPINDSHYAMSLRYYAFQDQVEGYLIAQTTAQVKAWIADPNTNSADLEAAQHTIAGLLHMAEVPGVISWFSDWIDRADWVLDKAGLNGARNNSLKALDKVMEEARKLREKQEEEKKKREQDCIDPSKCEKSKP